MSSPEKMAAAAEAAVAAENSTGVPAEILIAQFALESGWGDHMPGLNCYGIKEYQGCYGRQLLKTTEWFTDAEVAYFLARNDGRTAERDTISTVVTSSGRRKYFCQDWFATFPTLAACFERRAKLFDIGKYKPLTDKFRVDRDVTAFVLGFAPTYATAPDYGTTLLKIIKQHNVAMALNVARGGGTVA